MQDYGGLVVARSVQPADAGQSQASYSNGTWGKRGEERASRGGETGDTRAADSNGGRLLSILASNRRGIWCVCECGSGLWPAGVGLDGTVRLWETPSAD